MKIEMNILLLTCDSKSEEKKIREIYRHKTQRDLKHDREEWNSPFADSVSEINLLSDILIDKITSLYGLVIKNNLDCTIPHIHEALMGIIFHLSANDENCEEMH